MKQLRKPLAVLLAVLMLCTVLPLSALVVAADENLLVNGDFEAGTSNWNMRTDTAEVVDDPTGAGQGKVMKTDEAGSSVHLFDQTVNNLDADGDYILTFKVYCYSTASKPAFWATIGYNCIVTYNTADVTGLEAQEVDSSSSTRVRLNCTNMAGQWITVSIPFNMNGNTTTRIMISNYRTDAGQYYFDDIVLTKAPSDEGGDEPDTPIEPDEPAGDNVLQNGDFEAGTSNWILHNDDDTATEVIDDPTGSGRGKVMHTNSTYNNSNGRDDMFYQTVTLEQNTDYVLTLKAYCYSTASNAAFIVNWYDKTNGEKVTYNTADVTGLGCQNIDSSSAVRCRLNVQSNTGKWVDVTIPFNSGNVTEVRILIANYRVEQGQYYFDDIVLTKAADEGGDEPDTPDDPDQPVSESDVAGNMLVNGNFATGDLTGWENLYGYCTTAIVDGYNSTYGLQVTTAAAWNMVRQKVNVDTNTYYELSIWAKAASSMTLLVKDGADTTNVAQASLSGSEWTKYTIKFNSGDYTSIYVSIMGSVANASVIVDSAVLVKGSSNLLQNGDFETGDTTGWTNLYDACTLSMTDGHTGSYGLSFAGGQWNQTRQKVSVQANTNYVLTGWAKDGSSASFLVKDSSDANNIAQISIGSGSEWTKYSVTFNTGDNTSIYVGMMAGGSGGSAIVDDISLEKETAVVENLSTNGDFETGDLTGWTKYQSTAVSSSAALNGSYGVSVKGPGDWGGTLDQQVSVVAGRTYQLSFWYRAVSNGMNFVVRNADKESLTTAVYLKDTIWTKYEATFVADGDTVNLHFNGSGKGTTDELYVDDVTVIDLSNSGNRAEVLTSGGSSIRDTDDDNRGLAFRFTVAVNDAQVYEGTNVLVPNAGSIKLFKHNDVVGTLVGAGAIVTNNAAIDTNNMTHENVDDKKTIDIPVKYLLDLEPDSIGFAVRIINIPDTATETDIYARPYYTYELNGEQVTVYGDAVRNNYASVDANRRAVRVLTVGDTDGFDSYLYDMLKDADYDQVILGSYTNGTYSKNDDNGQWVNTNCDADTAIADERWQYIVVTNDADLTWAENNKTESTAQVLYYANDVAVDAAWDNLDTVLDATDDQQEYTASLTWYVTLTGESLDLVNYDAAFADTVEYDMRRAAVHACAAPDEVTDLNEIVLVAGSDFQPATNAQGIETLQGLLGSLQNNGYDAFDGLLFVGDYTREHGSALESGDEGQDALEDEMTKYANFGHVYSQGNHDHKDIDGMDNYGNNDPVGGKYGVFVINEDNYDAYGNGGKQVATDLTAYFAEKKAAGWGNQPIFVMSHLPLHYNYRTMKDGGAKTASYIIEALNAASDDGFNIIFLIGHNHSGGYDDSLGGAAIYIPKGDTIPVPDASNYKNAPIETELKFTYMNAGYVSYYNDMGEGADCSLTMSTFRIQQNGDVIITRYDADGVHNLKSAGVLSPYDRDYTEYTVADGRVYESSRIVGAFKDEEYDG